MYDLCATLPDADGDHFRLGVRQELVAADGSALYHNAVFLRSHALKKKTNNVMSIVKA